VNAPLLRCRGARIEVDGAVLLSALEVDADGARVVLAGTWEPLFRLLSRTAAVTRGSVEVLGAPAHTALRDNHLGMGARDLPFASSSKALESLVASARLLGLGKRDATRRAEAVLDELGLGALAKSRFSALDRAARRALSIARAVLGDPPAIAIERPFEGLEDERALIVESVLGKAAAGRRLLLYLAAPTRGGPEARAIEAADRVVVLRAGAVATEPGALPLDSPSGKLDS
jgi:ABC-type Na+ transport system ATPase subunit NatA